MDVTAATGSVVPENSSNSKDFLLSEDLLEQVVLWLPVPAALKAGRVSKAFSKVALAAARCAVWASSSVSTPFTVALDHSYYVTTATDRFWSQIDPDGRRCRHHNRGVGTPCADLRPGGDAVDCSSLNALLDKAFASGDCSSADGAENPASWIPRAGRSGSVGVAKTHEVWETSADSKDQAEEPSRRRCLLRGLAVRSASIGDECVRHTLDSYGEALEVLDLAGCRNLAPAQTASSIARACKELVSLDLSGACESLGHTPPPTLLPQHWAHQNGANDLRDDALVCLLSNVGDGLECLRLRDCPHLTDEGMRAVAGFCLKLRELDIGCGIQSYNSSITQDSLVLLSSADCSSSLVYLGLRNRRRVGLHGGLSSLGTQFPGLRRLDLGGIDCINDNALEAIASTLSLTHIDLSSAKTVSSAGVAVLANGSPELEFISLHGGAVDDSAVSALCGACPGLRAVNLSMTRVTVRSLRALASKDSLRWVNLRCCPLDGYDAWRLIENLRRRLSAPKLPRDRGIILGMERPGGQPGSRGSLRSADLSTLPRPSPREHRARRNGSSPGDAGGERAEGRGDLDECDTEAFRLRRGGSFRIAPGSRGSLRQSDLATMPRPSPREHRSRWNYSSPGDAGGERTEGRGAGDERDTEAFKLRRRGSFRSASPATQSAASPAAAREHAPGPKADGDDGATRLHAGGAARPPSPAPSGHRSFAAAETAESEVSTTEQKTTESSSNERMHLRLPAEIGDLSLGNQRSIRAGVSRRGGFETARHTLGREAGTERSAVNSRGSLEPEDQSGIVAFDWDAVPRGRGLKDLSTWKGFRGLSGDLVKHVLRELHPFTDVHFVGRRSRLDPSRKSKNNHGFLVHASKYAVSWVEIDVDEQGCVV